MKSIDLTNKRFNKLLVISKSQNKGKKTMWKCKCDCGNITYVMTSNLTCNRIKSCGCLKLDKLLQRSTKHNQRHTNLYEVWKTMKQRCNNPNNISYKNYGGRGIKVCEDWSNSFESFFKWSKENNYKQGLTIDRIDVNGNYCPENCRFVSRIIQANNTRTNKYITYKNEMHTVAEWSRIFNISYYKVSKLVSGNTFSEDKLSKII